MKASRTGQKWFDRQVANKADVARYHSYDNFLACRAQQAVNEDYVCTRPAAECYVADDLRQAIGDLPTSVQRDLVEAIVWYVRIS